jgi:predicted anti-sigma-YlaC factor YlaD
MTITCKEAARMVSEGLDKELAPEAKLRLRAHLAICRGCQSISERMAFLRRAVKNITDRGDSGAS